MVSAVDMKHNIINGEDYKNLIIGAAMSLEDSKEEINELNVFPVPDGDTGSNMSMTVAEAARELSNDAETSLDKTAEITAKAMLHGARGNSGVITSLLFRGIAKVLDHSTECDGITWAKALQSGVEMAYTAIDRPAEGTILTVAKCAADAALEAAQKKNSFEYALGVAINAAEVALEKTVEQNPVLEKAGVVDAGGMGWLVVMKAMQQTLLNNKKLEYSQISEGIHKSSGADFSKYNTEDITFAFCTEFIINKHEKNSDSKDLKTYLSTMGDSIVMIDDGDIIKVHIHTNDPHAVLGEALKYGYYETVKVENMKSQHTNKIVENEAKAPQKEYGIISVANGEGITEMLKELGVDAIINGGQTMNPSTEDLYKATTEINAKTIFILPNNKNIIMTAKQVAELSEKNIIVIPTRSIPQGISAILAFDEGQDKEANEEAMCEMIKTVSTMQITSAARNSSFDGLNIKEGDYLALYEDKLLCSGSDMDILLDAFAQKIEEEGKSIITIYYGCDATEEEANTTLEALQSRLNDIEINMYEGKQPVYRYIISAE